MEDIKKVYLYEVGEYKFDTIEECTAIIDSIKWIEFIDEKSNKP